MEQWINLHVEHVLYPLFLPPCANWSFFLIPISSDNLRDVYFKDPDSEKVTRLDSISKSQIAHITKSSVYFLYAGLHLLDARQLRDAQVRRLARLRGAAPGVLRLTRDRAAQRDRLHQLEPGF